jgi:phosphate transport system permease protein
VSTVERASRTARRLRVDKLLRLSVISGGVLVLVAIASIFLFLIWETLPVFHQSERPASIVQIEQPNDESPLIQITADHTKLVSLTSAIAAYLAEVESSSQREVDGPPELTPSDVSLYLSSWDNGLVATSHLDGHLNVYDRVDWSGGAPFADRLVAKSKLAYPPKVIELYSSSAGRIHLVANDEGRLYWYTSPMLDSIGHALVLERSVELKAGDDYVHVLADGRWLLILNRSGSYRLISERGSVSDQSGKLSDSEVVKKSIALRSGYGILVVSDSDKIDHFGLTYQPHGVALVRVNGWNTNYAPAHILHGQNRHLFVIGETGEVEIYNSGTLARERIDSGLLAASQWLVSPDGELVGAGIDRVLILDPTLNTVSLAALYAPQVHEGYSFPDWIWQSTGVDPTSAPKYSLTPLLLGSLKAALYALLIAVPLAVSAALFTAHFMSEGLRARVKPALESLAALPTVVLGLIAGLWFAPWLEKHFVEFVTSLLVLPVSLVAASMLWRLSPAGRGESRLTGSELLLAAVFMLGGLALAQVVAPLLSSFLMPEGLVSYLSNHWGLEYEQRNALIVAFILGLALVPTVYTMAEDALFAVPIQLREGALALGATEWQAARSVILPAAAPGILSAIMMGMARGVGETMIVLMATGNTPLMDSSVFTGMRTLSATLAMEMPEVSPDTQHFHILMFIALQLFLFTFAINTLAEWIRSRLLRRMETL